MTDTAERNRERLDNPDLPAFSELGIDRDIVDALTDLGFASAFPIQAMTIPDALTGRDVCGKAKTGSGKTLAFGIPMIQQIGPAAVRRPKGLVLVPTRELCSQVTEDLEPLVAAKGYRLASIYGGVPMATQTKALDRGVEVVVATPGRLIDLAERGALSLDEVEIVVIDEADQMADMGFWPQVWRIMNQVTARKQTMLFSATLDGQVGNLIRYFMDDPVHHSVVSESITVDTSEHRFLEVHRMDKAKVAARIAEHSDRMMIFVRTKRSCDRVAADLRDLGVDAQAIHGDLPQKKRERVLDGLASGRQPVMVATNVAARGLHVEGVDIVLHFDPPEDPKVYLHRSGRTARAGRDGLVVTFVEWDQFEMVQKIQQHAGLHEPIVKMFSNDERLDDLWNWEPDALPEQETTEAKRSTNRRRRRRRL